MTREQMLAQLLSQIQTDANLLILLRAAVTKNLPNVDDDTLYRLYLLLNPPTP